MPCFFCVATVALIGSGVAATALEGIRAGLEQLARGAVTVTDDTASTQRLELDVAVPTTSALRGLPGRAPATVPVAVTVYKKHARVRVQVLSHDVTKGEAEAVQDAVVAAAGLHLVHRSRDEEQHAVHDAVDRLAHAERAADAADGRTGRAATWEREG